LASENLRKLKIVFDYGLEKLALLVLRSGRIVCRGKTKCANVRLAKIVFKKCVLGKK
jgi:TATA-box binding protein (TBP) (component of TFIID and TFIIIB)